MSPATARFFIWLSHGGGLPLLLLLLALLWFAANRAGAISARARVTGDEARQRLAAAVRWASGTLLAADVLLFAAAFFHVGCAYSKSAAATCLSNVRRLSLALAMYSQTYDERLSPAARWADAAREGDPKLARSAFFCPAADPPAGYGVNKGVDHASYVDIQVPAETVLLFEARSGAPSFSGGLGDVARGRHSGQSTVGLADGHAKMVNPNSLAELVWIPSSKSP